MIDINTLYVPQEELKTPISHYFPMYRAIRRMFDPNSVADVGCRTAHLITLFSINDVDVLGIDYFPWMKDNADHFIKPNFVLHDIRTDFHWDKQYEVVVSTEVGEHIDPEYAKTYLRNIKRLMMDEGVVIISWSNHRDRRGQHLNPLDKEQFISLMKECGFEEHETSESFRNVAREYNMQDYYLDNHLSVWKKRG